MRKLVLSFLLVLSLVGCSEKQVSTEVQARKESRAAAKKERDESREAAGDSREANKKHAKSQRLQKMLRIKQCTINTIK